MKMPKRHTLILTAVAAIVLLAIAYSFRAPAVLVDSAVAEKGLLQQVVGEEGRTRLPNRYQVAVPVTGYLSRVESELGDTEAQAQAALARAESALAAARTLVDAEQARMELAQAELERSVQLVAEGHLPRENLDRAQAEARRAEASVRSARFSVDVARHERDSARASVAVVGGDQVDGPARV